MSAYDNWANLEDLSLEDRIDSRDMAEWLSDYNDAAGEGEDRGDERDELARVIRGLAEDLDGEGWEWGIGFIADRDFEEYARELADDIGAMPEHYTWPTSCIDWEQAARELRMDYSATEINGRTFWYREA